MDVEIHYGGQQYQLLPSEDTQKVLNNISECAVNGGGGFIAVETTKGRVWMVVNSTTSIAIRQVPDE